RGLDVHVARVVGDRGGLAAHDAGEALDPASGGDDAHGFVELDALSVEQLERHAAPAPAHFQRAFDAVEIEDVRRPAELEHHVVRDVDERGDAALPGALEPTLHPLRRGPLRIDAANDAPREAAAEIGR